MRKILIFIVSIWLVVSRSHGNSLVDEMVHSIHKRANPQTGQPFNLNIGLHIVTDYSVYLQHQTYLQTTNSSIILAHMRTYFAYYVDLMNQRLSQAFASDPDLRINFVVTGTTFLTSTVSWSNPSVVGDSSFPTYNGREVIVAQPALDAFSTYMNSLSIPSYDYAIGFVNKDIWSSNSGSANVRSQTIGFSYFGQICSNTNKYSIVEEVGGFANLVAAAQEAGKILGSNYDGSGTSSGCSSNDNYIMSPSIGTLSVNLLNQYKYSSCSINAIKTYLLTSSLNTLSARAQCLSNVETNVLSELDIVQSTSTPDAGQVWSADDQCKLIYLNNDATFCRTTSSNICSTLNCLSSSTATSCSSRTGFGAVEGTACDSGKTCQQGQCLASSSTTTGGCIFGDGIIVNNTIVSDPLPSIQMSCNSFMLYIQSINKSPFAYCSDLTFRSVCCETCRIYNSFTCTDTYPIECPNNVGFCNDLTVTLYGSQVGSVCQRTCNRCTQVMLKCADNLCMNGATCIDVTGTPNSYIGFVCSCSQGYSGLLCQTKAPCNPNPCQNSGLCLPIGTTSYSCQCTSGFTGSTCSIGSPIVTSATTVSTASTTSTSSTTTVSSSSLCTTTTCQNGGVCQQLTTTYFCSCAPGFSGQNCEIDLTARCAFNNGNCASGSTCIIELGTYELKCVCPPLVTGSLCDQPLNTCYGPNGYPICENQGTCTVDATSSPYYKCACPTGFYGVNCQLSVSGGTCQDKNPSICPYYKQLNLCHSANLVNGESILSFCALSCEACTVSTTCEDLYPYACPNWCSYCTTVLININPHPCRKTCRVC